MSATIIQTFFEKANTDVGIQQKLQAVVPGDAAAETISTIARSHGFDFSAAELRAALGKTGALSDNQLEQVSGGIIIQGGITQGAIATLGHGAQSQGAIFMAFNAVK